MPRLLLSLILFFPFRLVISFLPFLPFATSRKPLWRLQSAHPRCHWDDDDDGRPSVKLWTDGLHLSRAQPVTRSVSAVCLVNEAPLIMRVLQFLQSEFATALLGFAVNNPNFGLAFLSLCSRLTSPHYCIHNHENSHTHIYI